MLGKVFHWLLRSSKLINLKKKKATVFNFLRNCLTVSITQNLNSSLSSNYVFCQIHLFIVELITLLIIMIIMIKMFSRQKSATGHYIVITSFNISVNSLSHFLKKYIKMFFILFDFIVFVYKIGCSFCYDLCQLESRNTKPTKKLPTCKYSTVTKLSSHFF